jgi:putative transport protein
VSTLGVVLFVFAVGLQAGPRFFKSFRKRGLSFALLALVTLAATFGTAVVLERLTGLGAPLSAGLFTGALTSTPGLAAALESLDDPTVSVAYGVAYPLGIVGVVLFAQLVPRLLRVDLEREAREVETAMAPPAVEVVWMEVRNPQLHQRTMGDFDEAHLTSATISRITKLGRTIPARSEAVLELGDRVRVVGTAEELGRMELLIGPRVERVDEPPSDITSRTVVVTEEGIVGKTLEELRLRQRHGVVITRLWRNDYETVPTGKSTLEFGDTIRIVGDRADCERFVPIVGDKERRLQHTNFLPLSVGLLLGVLVGQAALPLPGGIELKLGLAGGPLLVALVAGHFGRIGPFSFRVPVAAKYFIRELGLIFFLAAAGTGAGGSFLEVLQARGLVLVAVGLALTLAPLGLAWLLALRVLELDVLSTLGVICGSMTSTPGLGAVSAASDSEVPALAYATVYPVALIFVTLLSQLMAVVLA